MKSLTECFNREGWLLQEKLLSADQISQLNDFLDTRRSRAEEAFRAWAGGDEKLTYGQHQALLPEYEARGIPPDFRNFLVGQFDLETRLDQRIVDLLSTPAMMNFVRDFCGASEYYLHYPPMIRFKAPNAKQSVVPVHQDSAYSPHLTDFFTVWAPLTDIDEACGGVVVYEGSHDMAEVKHEASGAWPNRSVVDLTPYKAKHIHMKAGDLLLFSKRLLHESAPHTAPHLRYSIDFRVLPSPESTTKSYYDPSSRTIVRRH